MAIISITILHPYKDERRRCSVDDSITAAELIDDLVRLGFVQNWQYGYMVVCRTMVITPSQTLSNAGCSSGDVISLCVETAAGCFAEKTRVLLADGSLVPISEIKTGECVVAFDSSLGTYQSAAILGSYRQTFSSNVIIDGTLVVSPDQIFMLTDQQWRRAEDISVGDELVRFPYGVVSVGSVEDGDALLTMVSLTLPNMLCFVAENVVVKDFIGKQSFTSRKIDVFLSYAESDTNLARTIFDSLSRRGVSVFLAEKSLSPGAFWATEIRDSLKACREFWILLTRASLQREWVASEWAAAWVLEKKIVPILHRCDINDLPDRLRMYQAVDYYQIDGVIETLWGQRAPTVR